ncbi:hypothetical protein PPL_02120 [Heterostelium album PN500]|uniref:LIM zinc-binding domain-containing protein n=1 Tax=Heterostelium pallidum (strain ATCC 26659 / Pp 5 / PN500) TaxID=670386 RepID=D3B1E8_HETP5|nr:hypothetical protein PPL_02120 [Heterostelium album PN500]EFA85122.1 hypothetical protein PPL_02120 [Heterostelium album PN500]|eukprot:XP_020437231.1 hypothetical protein PPL_02120 [Heterostelium album PN500]
MSSKCPTCTKTVYFAERQMKDGVAYHGACLQKVLKETRVPLVGRYPGDEDRIGIVL